jgi:transcriptional regulator with XRE-family HTH domain
VPRKSNEPIDVRSIREKLKLNSSQLAARLGVTKGAVSQWESGTSNPSVSVAYMLRGLEAEVDNKKVKSGEGVNFVLEIKLTADETLLAALNLIIEGLKK